MRDRLIELIRSIPNMEPQCRGRAQGKTYLTAEHIADHLLENGVIVPPCKVGDKVFTVLKDTRVFDNIEFVVTGFEIRSNHPATYRAICEMNNNIIPLKFGDDNIGKTVFLTREEAEKALAERSGE